MFLEVPQNFNESASLVTDRQLHQFRSTVEAIEGELC